MVRIPVSAFWSCQPRGEFGRVENVARRWMVRLMERLTPWVLGACLLWTLAEWLGAKVALFIVVRMNNT